MATDTESLQIEVDRLRLELESLKSATGTKNISVANYLLTRLAQQGVTVCLSHEKCVSRSGLIQFS